MPRTTDDAGNYFQTDDSLATIERKAAKSNNTQGNPIKLPSKILAVEADPFDPGAIYVAEAAGNVRRVVLETRETKRIPTPACAPLTCLTICPTTKSLFAGCWDKTIYRVALNDTASSTPPAKFSGHTDFVKCLLITSLSGRSVLISGAADATIILWDTATGKQLHKLKGHTKAIQDLSIDPLSLSESPSTLTDSLILFSASSDREIRRWHVSLTNSYELPEETILAHDTSVYKLAFDSCGDLWTCSADKTARHLVRDRAWAADTVLQHPDFVRDVAISEKAGLVVTACRDEEVRVWDCASGDLVCTYSGHYEEVTGLVVLGDKVVSVGIDGTVRQWALGRKEMGRYFEELGSHEDEKEIQAPSGALTAEEEAELDDLMADAD